MIGVLLLVLPSFIKSNQSKDIDTNFSIVRFGNVLESSGSVIPKFKKQIRDGGPVTLTHKDVTRYFMTVTEAAQLVIQAGAMGRNSEIFVLDMGESVKIRDLIYKMINLSGFRVRDNKNQTGDIEVKIIGLRSGEKLYEELLISGKEESTPNGKIFKSNEDFPNQETLNEATMELQKCVESNNIPAIKNILKKHVEGFKGE